MVEHGTVNSQSDSDWAAFSSLQEVDTAYDSNARPVTQSLVAGGTIYALTQASYDALGRVQCTAQRMNPATFGSLPSDACTLGTAGSYGYKPASDGDENSSQGAFPQAVALVWLLPRLELKLSERRLDRVEEARGLEVVDAGEVAAAFQAEMGEEGGGGGIGEGAAGHLAAAGGADPASLHQHVQRAPGDLHAPDRLDLGAADRLVIGDDGERLDRRARQPPRLVALPAQDVGEVGGGLEMPAPAALDEVDTATGIVLDEPGEAGGNVHSEPDMLGDVARGQGLGGGEQGGLDGAEGVVRLDHAARM